MRIIKNGHIPEEKVYQKTCSNCGCIFTYTKKEKKMDFNGGLYLWCPCCNQTIYTFWSKKYKKIIDK